LIGEFLELSQLPTDIFCVVRMDDVESDIPAARVEYAAKVQQHYFCFFLLTQVSDLMVGWSSPIWPKASFFTTISVG